MVEKLKEVSSISTTDDYAVLVTVEVLPQTSELLFALKEENTNAVLYKIEGAMDSSFADAQVLRAELLLIKNGSASKVLNDSWLWVRVLHKAAVEGSQGKTSCVVSGSSGLGSEDVAAADSVENDKVRDVVGNKEDAAADADADAAAATEFCTPVATTINLFFFAYIRF